MKPEDNSSQSGLSLSQQSPDKNNDTQQTEQQFTAQQEAAAGIIRSQIDNLFKSQEPNNVNLNEQQNKKSSYDIEIENPYKRTHSKHSTLHTNDWKQYHTAWQNYYKKYYEGYYKNHISKSKTTSEFDETKSNNGFSAEEAVFNIKQNLIKKAHESANKIKKSRHFIPIISGIIVMLIFIFLQYNRLIISNVMAYVSPGDIDPQNIIVDPNIENVAVSPNPKLIIPKINIDAPVFYDIGSDYKSQMVAMDKGLAHFAIPGASSHPGQIGNTVISGHSSNDLLDSGDYKFIFVQLEKLEKGDVIYANYKSKRYTYVVSKKEVVKPNESGKLIYPIKIPILTLITCVPIGTANSRLLVTAKQISPDPNLANKTPENKTTTKSSIPGNSPTFLERLFGA